MQCRDSCHTRVLGSAPDDPLTRPHKGKESVNPASLCSSVEQESASLPPGVSVNLRRAGELSLGRDPAVLSFTTGNEAGKRLLEHPESLKLRNVVCCHGSLRCLGCFHAGRSGSDAVIPS